MFSKFRICTNKVHRASIGIICEIVNTERLFYHSKIDIYNLKRQEWLPKIEASILTRAIAKKPNDALLIGRLFPSLSFLILSHYSSIFAFTLRFKKDILFSFYPKSRKAT